jgi:membrane associated rhomboid family serine protease
MVSGVGASLASAAFQLSVGASGGICAILGILADGLVNWDLFAIRDQHDEWGIPYKAAISSLVIEIAMLVVIGLTPFIDQFAHLGGLFLL